MLPSGPIPPDPGEFVSSPALGKILGALRERAEVVLVDAPGALDVGDVVALASRVDGIVVVARSKVLRRRTLAELDRLLTMVRAPALGFVATGEGEDEATPPEFRLRATARRVRRGEAIEQGGARLNAVLVKPSEARGR